MGFLDRTYGFEQDDPQDYESLVTRYANEYGVPTNLALAMTGAESSFNPDAQSHVGATGLMQLMPATAKRYGVEDIRDPEQNVRGGMNYLSDLYKEFGSWELAVAGYHAGEGNVRKAGNRIPDTNDGLISTRDHVAKVLSKAGPLDNAAPVESEGSFLERTLGQPAQPQQVAQPASTSILDLPEGHAQAATDASGRMSKSDMFRTSVSAGAATTLEGIGWLTGKITGPQNALEQWARGRREELEKRLQADPEYGAAAKEYDAASGFTETMSTLAQNPILMGDMLARMMPDLVLGAATAGTGAAVTRGTNIAGRVAANAARAKGLGDEAVEAASAAASKQFQKQVAIASASGASGATAGAQAGAEVENYLIQQGKSPEEAAAIANEAALQVGVATAALDRFGTGGLLGKAVTGEIKDAGVKATGKAAVMSGLEEGAQNTFEGYSITEGKRTATPDLPFDAGKEFATGLAVGGAAGAGLNVGGRANASDNPAAPAAEPAEQPKPADLITPVNVNQTMKNIGEAATFDEALAHFTAAVSTPLNIPKSLSLEGMTQIEQIKAVRDTDAVRSFMQSVAPEERNAVLQNFSLATSADGRVPAALREKAAAEIFGRMTDTGVFAAAQKQVAAKANEGDLTQKAQINDATKLFSSSQWQQYVANQPENLQAAIRATEQAVSNEQVAEPIRAESAKRALDFAKKSGIGPQEGSQKAPETSQSRERAAAAPNVLAENKTAVASISSNPKWAAFIKSAPNRDQLVRDLQDVNNESLSAGYRNARAANLIEAARDAGIELPQAQAAAQAGVTPLVPENLPEPSAMLAKANVQRYGVLTTASPERFGPMSLSNFQRGGLSAASARLTQALGTALGRRVVFFAQKGGSTKVDGFVFKDPAQQHTIFLNQQQSGGASIIGVFGHEFFHSMPDDLKAAFMAAVTGQVDMNSDAAKSYTADRKLTEGDAIEEISADLFGTRMQNPELIAQALDSVEDVSLAQRLFNHVRAVLKRIIDALGGLKDFKTEEMVKDLKAIDDAWVKGMRDYLKREMDGKGTIGGRESSTLSMEELASIVDGKGPKSERAQDEVTRRERKSSYEDINAVKKVAKAAKVSDWKGWPALIEKMEGQGLPTDKAALLERQLAARKKRDAGQLMTAVELELANAPMVEVNPDAKVETGETQPNPDAKIETGETKAKPDAKIEVERTSARKKPEPVADPVIEVGLSPATESIAGIKRLFNLANGGSEKAHKLLQDIAFDSLEHLMRGTSATVKADRTTGVFEGVAEPSARLSVSFSPEQRKAVLARLAKFAQNFNQKQVHVRQPTTDPLGTVYDDGSYATLAYRWTLRTPLTRAQVQEVINQSGLYGLTFGKNFVEGYYVGNNQDEGSVKAFKESIRKANELLAAGGGRVTEGVERLWPYGEGGIGYDTIAGNVPAGESTKVKTALRVASFLNDAETKSFEQAATITAEQDTLQREIADIYDQLPVNDLSNPNVQRAYNELAKELVRQYETLPVKVEVYTGNGEPYANSDAMRRDILDNNHLFIYGTNADSFGPEGSDFTGHPMLEPSPFKDTNGYPLLMNDILRAVHDYFAHGMSATQFGPKGEEAAWKNHMAATNNPWARWALTMETRGQNSWVNFNRKLDRSTPISDRPFADQKAGLLPAKYALTGDEDVDTIMRDFMDTLSPDDLEGSTEAISASQAMYLPDLTAPQQAAVENVIGKPKTLKERMREFSANWQKELVQGIFDQFAPIKELSHKAYVMARMSKAGDGALEALFMYGKIFVDNDGFYDVQYQKANGPQGFAHAMGKLDGEHDRFLLWVASQRAADLKSIGLENLFSTQDIAALKTLDQGNMKSGRSRAQAYSDALMDLMDFNDSVLKVAEDSGLIDSNTRAMFAKTPYVPFYRLVEDDPQFTIKAGLVNQEAWKKLKGGTSKLNEDLMANLLMNWSHLITASAKNRAAGATLEAAKSMGIAQEVNASATGKGIVRFKDQGKERAFIMGDAHLMDAIASLESASLGVWSKPFVAMKRALTFGVTVNPSFKIRNLLRDTISAIGVSELSYNPAENLAKGWSATATDSEIRARMLAGGGMMRLGSMVDGNTAERAKMLIKKGVNPAHIIDSDNKLQALWKKTLMPAFEAYQEFTDRGEQVNRAALYQRMIDKGMSHGEASYMARDLMDFSSSGKWVAVRTLASVVPFMNARLQGMYKLGRASMQDKKRFGTVIGAVSLASIGLMLAYGDDDDWNKREDSDRQNYWWFKIGDTAYRIPKPFEIGVIGTIAEMGVEYFSSDEMTGERFRRNLGQMVGNQLAMNPVPQLVKPLMDIYSNTDSFTRRPIENLAMQRLRPEDRVAPNTSEAARFLGSLGLPDPATLLMGSYRELSPVQVDHMVRGYFGWLGTMTSTALDYGLMPMVDRGAKPAMRLKDVFVIGNFSEELPSGTSRYVSQMYQQAKEIEEAYGSYRNAIKAGDVEQASEIKEENPELVNDYKRIQRIKREESSINAMMKQVSNSKTLSPETKRRMLDDLERRRDSIARKSIGIVE